VRHWRHVEKTITMSYPLDSPYEPGATGVAYRRRHRVVLGVAVSLALHALLLFGFRLSVFAPAATDGVAVRSAMAVWLRPPKVEPPVVPVARPKPERPVARQIPNPVPRQPRAAARTELIAVQPSGASAAEPPDMFAVAPTTNTPAAPSFDPEAARRMARKLANEPDPAKVGTAVAQLAPKPYATETKEARAVAGAKRRDCKDGLPGGLLAPLFLLMDKKDSGCKW
jgi:hypothetical protein